MNKDFNSVIESMLAEQLIRTDKYRHDCVHCVRVLGIPIDISFCSYKIMGDPFPRGVNVILQCPKDCDNFFQE